MSHSPQGRQWTEYTLRLPPWTPSVMTGYNREEVVAESTRRMLEAMRDKSRPPPELHENPVSGEESVESHDSTAHASTPTYQPELHMPSSQPPPPTPVQQKPPLESGAESTNPMYLTYNLPTYPVRDTDGNETGLVQIKQEELQLALTQVFTDGVNLRQKTALQSMTDAGLSTGQHDYLTQGWQQQSTNLLPTASGYSLGTSSTHMNLSFPQMSVSLSDYQPELQMPSSLPPPPMPVQQKPPLESGAKSTDSMYLINLPTVPITDINGNLTGLVQISKKDLQQALDKGLFDGLNFGRTTALQNMTGAGLFTGQHGYPTQGWQQQSTYPSPTASGYSLGTLSTNTNLSIPQMPVSLSDYQPEASTLQLLSPPPSAQGVPGGPNGQFSYAGQSASSATGRDPAERLL